MKNAANWGISEELLKDGKEIYQGKYYMGGKYIKRDSPRTRWYIKPQSNELCSSIKKACECCSAHDRMTVSFHSEFREGNYVASMVAKVLVEEMGPKDITTATMSLGSTQDLVTDYTEQGKVIGVQTFGIRGRIGEAISAGKLTIPVVIRSHGGYLHAVEARKVCIGITFLTTPTSDCWSSAEGVGDKNNYGSMGLATHDSHYTNHTAIITDTLVDFPNRPPSISAENVDYVCVVDSIGDTARIATKEACVTEDPRELMMAERTAEVIATTPYFTDDFSLQTGAGGSSLVINRFIEKRMAERGIKMSSALGGMTNAVCQLLDKGPIGAILDTQDFNMGVIKHLVKYPRHHKISISEYASPASKGAYISQLDFVTLSALEIDVNFSANVIIGSGGVLRGTLGDHPDTTTGSKCCIIVTPLTRSHMATVCDEVITIIMPDDCANVLVTGYDIAVNPLHNDLAQCLDAVGIEHVTIEWLRDKAYSLVGTSDMLEWEDQIVVVVEARDDALLGVVRKIRPLQLDRRFVIGGADRVSLSAAGTDLHHFGKSIQGDHQSETRRNL